MKIQSFYRQSRCEKMAGFEKLIFQEGRHLILKKATDMVCTLLMAGTERKVLLSQVRDFLKNEYEKMPVAFGWQHKQYMHDVMLYYRLFSYLEENYPVLLKAHLSTFFEVAEELPDGSCVLEGKVHLLYQDEDGRYHGMIIHSGTCSRSVKGKTIHTTAATDLHSMVAKYSLEKEYPDIVIHPVYLTHKEDKPDRIRTSFEVSDYASSNVHSLYYGDYYEDATDVFDYETFGMLIQNVVNTRKQDSCYGCSWGHLCKTPLLSFEDPKESAVTEEGVSGGYVMPIYTAEQLEVVHHVDGPMRVCAGPGSGKTATLIGRIKYLVEECKVPPQFILVVTFTREAATELKNRCLSFLDENNLPKISTLNAFCYGVLRENEDLLDRELNILTDTEKMRIVKNMVSVLPRLTGFKYAEREEDNYGPNGLYKTVSGRLDKYFSLGDYAFFQKYPELGSDFVDFARMYQEIIESKNYITFDEQITLCNQLFCDYPDVLAIYSTVYKYVMVDEYQDVNEAQVTMLYSLASHGNIVVVGDDDQSIYGFRGASADFMIRFPERFPSAKTVVFKDNFRSTKALVDAAQSLISNNKLRISKDIRSGKGIDGVLPMVIPSLDNEAIDSAIEGLLKEGFSYDDIAVLSTKNAPLEELHSSLKAPTLLAKSYLREDGLFIFAYNILQLYEDMGNDKAFLQFMTLFGKAELVCRKPSMTLYESTLEKLGLFDFRLEGVGEENHPLEKEFSILNDFFSLLDKSPSISVYLDACKYALSWNTSNSMEVLMEELEKQGLSTLEEMYQCMTYIVNFSSEIRVEVNGDGKVTLITCHDSKGKEWPIVLIRNDYTSFTEEVRRLFYVGITRAQERLYVMQDASCKVDFLKEIPHIKEDVKNEKTKNTDGNGLSA